MKIVDVVIPFHPKDLSTVKLCCFSLKNVVHVENIFLVSSINPHIEGTNFIDEKSVNSCMNLQEIFDIWNKKNVKLSARSGWLYQQFIKLSAPEIIKNISENFLVCDSDIFFLRNPYQNISDEVFPYANAFTGEYHIPYKTAYSRLMNHEPPAGFSFINHNMVFNTNTLSSLKLYIENLHQKRWDHAIMDCISFSEASCFSEYDLYGNWAYQHMKHEKVDMKIAQMNVVPTQQQLEYAKLHFPYHIISSQEWQRNEK